MAHSKQDVMQARADYEAAGLRLIEIYSGAIQAIKNSQRGVDMISAEPKVVPLREDDVPVVKGFFKRMAEGEAA